MIHNRKFGSFRCEGKYVQTFGRMAITIDVGAENNHFNVNWKKKKLSTKWPRALFVDSFELRWAVCQRNVTSCDTFLLYTHQNDIPEKRNFNLITGPVALFFIIRWHLILLAPTSDRFSSFYRCANGDVSSVVCEWTMVGAQSDMRKCSNNKTVGA